MRTSTRSSITTVTARGTLRTRALPTVSSRGVSVSPNCTRTGVSGRTVTFTASRSSASRRTARRVESSRARAVSAGSGAQPVERGGVTKALLVERAGVREAVGQRAVVAPELLGRGREHVDPLGAQARERVEVRRALRLEQCAMLPAPAELGHARRARPGERELQRVDGRPPSARGSRGTPRAEDQFPPRRAPRGPRACAARRA
jgi:hypothetical protein